MITSKPRLHSHWVSVRAAAEELGYGDQVRELLAEVEAAYAQDRGRELVAAFPDHRVAEGVQPV